jgi:hypothetical protein
MAFGSFEVVAPGAILRWRRRVNEGAPDYAVGLGTFFDRHVLRGGAADSRVAKARTRTLGIVVILVLTLECALFGLIFALAGWL